MTAETWLFDLGNSRAKAARLVRGSVVDVAAFRWEAADFDAALRAHLAQWPHPDAAWVASVAGAAEAGRLRATLAHRGVGRVEWLRTPRRHAGLVNRYARPERLGIDRFLAMLAVHRHVGAACIVIGCGTALTLDAVSADGVHAEGLIAAAPAAMLEALRGGTAIAAANPDAFREPAADDTAQALHAGCWAAAGALVRWFAARRRGDGGTAPVVLHGGWAPALSEWLHRDGFAVTVEDDAVLRGLALWAAPEPVAARTSDG